MCLTRHMSRLQPGRDETIAHSVVTGVGKRLISRDYFFFVNGLGVN